MGEIRQPEQPRLPLLGFFLVLRTAYWNGYSLFYSGALDCLQFRIDLLRPALCCVTAVVVVVSDDLVSTRDMPCVKELIIELAELTLL